MSRWRDFQRARAIILTYARQQGDRVALGHVATRAIGCDVLVDLAKGGPLELGHRVRRAELARSGAVARHEALVVLGLAERAANRNRVRAMNRGACPRDVRRGTASLRSSRHASR